MSVCATHGTAVVQPCSRCRAPRCERCAAWGSPWLICPACPWELRPAAGPGRRVLAHLVDVASFFVPLLVVILLGLWEATDDQLALRKLSEVPLRELNGWTVLAAFASPFALQTALQFVKGRSLGKWLFGLRLAGLDGRPIHPLFVILARNVGPLVLYGFCGIVPLVDLLMFVFPPHQRWRDRILKARVIVDPRVAP